VLMVPAAILGGLGLLVWSADRFVEGAAATARHAGMSALLIGMLVVGFGTSVPEMIVSALSAYQGNPALALGNAYGSNIANIALILGLTALLSPISVHSSVLRKELPILTVVTFLALSQLLDGTLTRPEAGILLAGFSGLMAWTVRQGMEARTDSLEREMEAELVGHAMTLRRALVWLFAGLLLLMVSSRLLVWGAVELARWFGISDLLIGLTVVAVGTSLPELASSMAAARKKEHDIALGNVLGSNLFNTLAVVGIAGGIHPMAIPREILYRDGVVMVGLTLSLFVICYGFRGRGRVNRVEGFLLLVTYVVYTGILVAGAVHGP